MALVADKVRQLPLAASHSCAVSSAKTTRLPAGSVTVAVLTQSDVVVRSIEMPLAFSSAS
jgi:hypothetical protein